MWIKQRAQFVSFRSSLAQGWLERPGSVASPNGHDGRTPWAADTTGKTGQRGRLLWLDLSIWAPASTTLEFWVLGRGNERALLANGRPPLETISFLSLFCWATLQVGGRGKKIIQHWQDVGTLYTYLNLWYLKLQIQICSDTILPFTASKKMHLEKSRFALSEDFEYMATDFWAMASMDWAKPTYCAWFEVLCANSQPTRLDDLWLTHAAPSCRLAWHNSIPLKRSSSAACCHEAVHKTSAGVDRQSGLSVASPIQWHDTHLMISSRIHLAILWCLHRSQAVSWHKMAYRNVVSWFQF